MWLERYLYTYIHDILFSKIPIGLYEWFLKLATRRKNFPGGEPTESNPQSVQRLKSTRNSVPRVVNFWVDSILEGYITRIFDDTITSYIEAKRNFSKDHEEDTLHV